MADPNLIFIAGGTLPSNSPSYIERKADQALLAALRQGEFAYVLDSRQKGKSSLMIRTRERLDAEGVRTVLLDLQRFGSNLGPEQWYGSMLLAVGEELGIEDALLGAWDAQPHAGPMKRFFTAIEQALAGLGPVVIFIDEIDFVRSLPFATDEFFAGIRESFNRRAAGSVSNLTFCLLGVATPSELIRDVQITPFNVGTRVDLTDFTLGELAPYEAALGASGPALVRRIHHWTGGHPYLTQKLAAAVAADASVSTPGGVDRLVEAMFFSVKARAEEPNLSDVSRRVLETPVEGVSPEEARSRVLDLYRQVRDGRRVRDDETDPVVSILKLSGLTRILEGYLVVRNRVYFRAFDRAWVEANLPDAELVRQRRAARAAAMRVGLIAGGVAVAIGALALFAFVKANEAQAASAQARALARSERAAKEEASRRARQATDAGAEAARRAKEAEEANAQTKQALTRAEDEKKRADAKAEEARRANEATKSALAQATREKIRAQAERRKAVEQRNRADTLAKQEAATAASERLARQANDRLLYQANMNLIQTAFENNQYGRVQELLDESAKPQFSAFRGPEWGYWDYRMNTHLFALKGHTGPARSAAFSPDGTRLVTASWDRTARVWDARDGREIAALKGHDGPVNSAAFSPDGTRIVTASWDKTARVWDARDGREIAALKGHGSSVRSAAFSPDGTRVVTASGDNTAQVWDARDGREIAALKGHTSWVTGAAFSPDGTRVVTASADKTARVWDARDGREIATLKGHTDWINSAAFSPDGTRIVTASGDQTARVWDGRDGREIAALKGHTGSVSSVAFSPDGARIVTASSDNTARVWDARDGREISALNGHTEQVNSAAFSPDGTRVVTATDDKTARVWDARDGREIAALNGHTDSVVGAAFSPDGTRVVTASDDGTARVWDARDGREIATLKGQTGPVSSAAFSPDGTRIVTGRGDRTARVWDARTGKQTAKLEGHTSFVNTAAFSPDGARIVTASSDNTARVWDARDGREISALNGHTEQVNSAAFSPDGTRVVTTSDDNTARVWDARDGRLIAALNGHTGGVHSAAFSPDGKWIVTASWDDTARVWDARTGKQTAKLEGHTSFVNTAAFSPDGTRIVTASADKTTRVWDARDGREVTALKGHTGTVSSAAFSPDGRFLLVGTGDESQIIPLSREAASKLTFVRPERFVADQLKASAQAGDLFAWNWQVKHWLTPEIARTDEVQGEFDVACGSPNREIAADARQRLKGLPISYLRSQVEPLSTAGKWRDLEDVLRQVCGDPRATATERKALALVRLQLGDREGWIRSARAAASALKPDAPADDIIQAAIAVRAAPDALEDYASLLAALEQAVASDPERYASAASPGALLYRAGQYAEAEKRLQASAKADSHVGQVFMAKTLAKLGRPDEAKAMLQIVEDWAKAKPAQGNAPTNLDAQTWDFRLELQLLIKEASQLLGLPPPIAFLFGLSATPSSSSIRHEPPPFDLMALLKTPV